MQEASKEVEILKRELEESEKIDQDWVMKRYFEFKDNISNKFWEISLKKTKTIITFGRIGIKNPASQVKEFSSNDEAKKHAERKIKEKINKGYLEKNSKTGRASSASKKIKENLKTKDDFIEEWG